MVRHEQSFFFLSPTAVVRFVDGVWCFFLLTLVRQLHTVLVARGGGGRLRGGPRFPPTAGRRCADVVACYNIQLLIVRANAFWAKKYV